jgi:two-component system, OmpR family, phosphate regulon sensor histidine kinase PhoR
MKDQRIRTRLMILTLAVLLLSLMGSMVIANHAFSTTLRENTYTKLANDAAYLVALLGKSQESLPIEDLNDFSLTTAVRITLVDTEGIVLYDSGHDESRMDNHAFRPEIVTAKDFGFGTAERRSATQQAPVLYHAEKIEHGSGIDIVRVSSPLAQIEQYNHTYQVLFSGGLALLLAITIIVTIFSIRKITRPLEEIHAVVQEYAQGNLSARSSVESPQELAELSQTMNTMAHELQSQIATIEDQKQQYSTILNSMTEGILYLDPQLVIVEANHAAMQLLKGSDESADNLKSVRLVQLTGSTELLSACTKTLMEENPQILEIARYGHLFGETASVIGRRNAKILRIAINPVIIDATVNGLVMTINDVTELKRLEQIRKEFVANVSHELKTPITAIAGFTGTLLESKPDDPETTMRFLHIINRQAILMQRIVEDLLLLSSLEQQNASPVKTWTTAGQIINETLEACNFKAQEKQSTLVVEVDNPEQLEMFVNGMLIVQALSNLVINALTYSDPQSSVLIRIVVTEEQVVFRVKDSGYGIPKDALERIFERFYRVDKARSRHQGGTGLGLSIVKHIVQVHGGIVEVESQDGEGSTFTMVLPRSGGDLSQLAKKSTLLYNSRSRK